MGADADAGLFGPDTITWRIYREQAMLLGGGRALLLQVAHPLVGAGVTQHSDYRADPWGRLFRTLQATTTITFGTTREARAAARGVWEVHGRVKGVSTEDGGRWPAGTPYDARDPDLAMWVQATLVDTALLVYDRYVTPLREDERARFYEEQKRFAEMFGVPRDRQPATYDDFRAYVREGIDALVVTQAARDVLESIRHPPLPVAARPLRPALVEAVNLAMAWMLPPRLREELGLPWGPGRERLAEASRPLVRTLLPVTPSIVREFPQARRARRRLRAMPAA